MTTDGTILNGQFLPDNPSSYAEFLHKNEGQRVQYECKRIYRRRSNQQNKYLWSVPYKILGEKLSEITGLTITKEDVHLMMTEKFSKDRKEITNLETGEVEEIVKAARTSEMSTVEHSNYCEFLRRYGATFLGVDIPEPQELIQDKEGYEGLQ